MLFNHLQGVHEIPRIFTYKTIYEVCERTKDQILKLSMIITFSNDEFLFKRKFGKF